jgi:hypothetical protein
MGMSSDRSMWVRRGWLIAVAGAAAIAAPGMAQHREGFEKPLGMGEARAGGVGRSTGRVETYMSTQDGDTKYEVSIVDDQITAKINGEELPADRVRKSDGKVELLDEKGKVIRTFNVGRTTTLNLGGNGLRRMNVVPPQVPAVPDVPAVATTINPPPVMIGITMGEVPESVAEHLGLEADHVVMIDRVVDGLPAEKAGLQAKDIVVKFDGKNVLSEDGIREILRGKKPGDKVEVEFLRKGERKTVTVELAKFDAGKVGAVAIAGDENPAEEWGGMEGLEHLEGLPAMGEEGWQRFADRIRKQGEENVRGFRNRDGGPQMWFRGNDGWQALGQAMGQGSAEQRQLMDQLRAQADALRATAADLKAQAEELKKQQAELRKLQAELQSKSR